MRVSPASMFAKASCLWACLVLSLGYSPLALAFTAPTMRASTRPLSHLSTSIDDGDKGETAPSSSSQRRVLIEGAIATAASLAFLPFEEASAFGGGGLKRINARLSNYGLPPMATVPDGFSPLLEIYGRGRNRDPLLVEFAHPSDWVVVLPNNDGNGEDGTIQAGQYAAGDTATLYVSPGEAIKDVTAENKDFFKQAIVRAISQKGDNVYQDFKVTKLETKVVEGGGRYAIVDFKYDLLTGAGFEVARVGVASITSEGNAVQVLWTASTRQRYKKTEKQLRAIADSFRCYADGIQFTDLLQAKEDDF